MLYNKFILIIFLFLIHSNLISAQVAAGILSYKLTVNDKETPAPRTENYKSYILANNTSIEFFIPTVVKDSYTQIDEHHGFSTSSYSSNSKREYFVYKNFEQKELILASNIEFKYFLINDTLNNFKWTISNEKKVLLKYNCIKATTKFRGRVYEAWFTEDIPLQNGPWKFCGLPGLIVKVNDAENIYTFELLGADFKSKFDTAIINIPKAYAKDKPITHNVLIKSYAKKVNELEIESRASVHVTENSSGYYKVTIPPLIEKF